MFYPFHIKTKDFKIYITNKSSDWKLPVKELAAALDWVQPGSNLAPSKYTIKVVFIYKIEKYCVIV